MKVAARLNLAVLPAIVGVLVLASLAYWGDRGRQAPEAVVALAIIATIASAVLSWRSTRLVSRRVGALADSFRALGLAVSIDGARDEFDELDRVRESVRTLADDQSHWRREAAEAIRSAATVQADHDRLLAQVSSTVAARLEETRLALHILQTSPFGELNENQEELVASARAAADGADFDLRQLVRLVTMPSRRQHASRESLSVRALVEPAVAIARSRSRDVPRTEVVDIPDDVPPVLVDRLAVQEGLSLLLAAVADGVPPGGEFHIRASVEGDTVELACEPPLAAADRETLPVRLALALLVHQGAQVVLEPITRIRVPAAPHGAWKGGRNRS